MKLTLTLLLATILFPQSVSEVRRRNDDVTAKAAQLKIGMDIRNEMDDVMGEIIRELSAEVSILLPKTSLNEKETADYNAHRDRIIADGAKFETLQKSLHKVMAGARP